MGDLIRVFLADDQELVRSGFRMLIGAEDDMEVAGEAADGASAVAAVLSSKVDVILMDIRMPKMDGVEATRRIVASKSYAKVLVLTTFDMDEYVLSALKAGAYGFMLKDSQSTELLEAIRTVARGESVLAPSATRRLLDFIRPALQSTKSSQDPRLNLLTEKEREVLREVACGSTNAEIATKLYMGDSTIKKYVSKLLLKLEVRDRVGLVLVAYEIGLVKSP